jgi:hypothetical protein
LNSAIFEDEDPVTRDIIRVSQGPSNSATRYHPDTREFAFELLRTCGSKALQMVRERIPLPSRQALCRHPPIGCSRSDLTNLELASARVRAWRSSISDEIQGTCCARCI